MSAAPTGVGEERGEAGASVPEFGHLLEPGSHLLEIGFAEARAASLDVICDGLERVGFADFIFDVATHDVASEWGSGSGPAPSAQQLGQRVRLIARLTRTLRLIDVGDVRWLYARRLTIDPFLEPMVTEVDNHELVTGALYELRFTTRLPPKAQPRRAYACDLLRAMGPVDEATKQGRGFVPEKLTLLKKNMRFRGQSGAQGTRWIAIARWTGPHAYITDNDPLFFEDVVRLDDEARAGTSS